MYCFQKLFTLILVCPLLFQGGKICFAGDLYSVTVRPIDFGRLILHPAGDNISIKAQNGPATPDQSRSVIIGGSSGELILTSQVAGHITVEYPTDDDGKVLTSGCREGVFLSDINTYSQKSVYLPGGGQRRSLAIGGTLHIPKNAANKLFINGNTVSCLGNTEVLVDFIPD